jgi:hypothetical protein
VPDRDLYKLWYETANFKNHWLGQYSNTAAKQLIFTVLMAFTRTPNLMYLRSKIVMLAWVKRIYPHVTGQWLERWSEEVLDKEWERLMPEIQKRRLEVNKRRNMKRKKGRPIDTDADSLRNRIKVALAVHPSTPAALAHQLGVNRNAVNGALLRMKSELVKIAHGLYTLPVTNSPK